jgi:hypothetical protein
MPPAYHPRLLNEAAQIGTDLILEQLPVAHSPALEEAIRQSIRQSLLHYAHGLDTLARQLHPLDRGTKARA